MLIVPLNYAIATALCRVTPTGKPKSEVDWLEVADAFITSVGGDVAIVPKEEYDITKTALRDAEEKLRALGAT